MSLFVDTSAWYAAADRSDASHSRAVEILSRGESLWTSDHVLIETWRLLAHRLGWGVGERFYRQIMAGVAAIEVVGSGDLETAMRIGERFPDQSFSIVDRTSFAVMERLGLERVATFDHHFAVYRFGEASRRAFEVVR
ncbi:MAG: PIN domain-containing protein [Acidobacteria bacterium]|nr:PIN domain-containing protein [Acidobacteriota bacterium]